MLFALRIKGNSIVEALIDHNDVVILRPPKGAKNIREGTIVAAKVGGQTTLEHLRPFWRKVMLKHANANYEPMLLESETVEIQGVLVGVMRSV